MNYTIKFNLDIDDDNIIEDEAIVEFLKDSLNSAGMTINDVQVLDVND